MLPVLLAFLVFCHDNLPRKGYILNPELGVDIIIYNRPEPPCIIFAFGTLR